MNFTSEVDHHTQTRSFCYNNNSAENAFYVITVTVININYIKDNESFYNISYVYEFNPGKHEKPEDVLFFRRIMHPLYLRGGITAESTLEDFNRLENSIPLRVIKNSLTEKMVQYLLMDDADLECHIGYTSVQKYRQNIMLSLSYYWY